jgi:hypothetical protein
LPTFSSWAFVYHLISFGLKRQVQRGRNTADIVETISKYTNKNHFTVYDIGVSYYCHLYVSRDGYLFSKNIGDNLDNYILAYKINDDNIVLIIKHYGYIYNEIVGLIQEIKYFNVELKEINGELIGIWHEMDLIDLHGLIINNTYVYDYYSDMVNIMIEPSIHSEMYDKLNNRSEVKVIEIENRREKINDMNDFWYKIEYNNKILWIYGYYVYCLNSIKIR